MKTWELQGPLSAPNTYWLLMIWKRMEHCQIWANLTWMLQRVKSSEPDLQRSCWWNNGFVIDTGLNWKGYIAQLCVCVCAPDTYEKGSQVERNRARHLKDCSSKLVSDVPAWPLAAEVPLGCKFLRAFVCFATHHITWNPAVSRVSHTSQIMTKKVIILFWELISLWAPLGQNNLSGLRKHFLVFPAQAKLKAL